MNQAVELPEIVENRLYLKTEIGFDDLQLVLDGLVREM